MLKLFKHQEEAIELYKQKNGLIYLNWETGTGKTVGALAIANANNFRKLLVVAPKSSHLSWQSEQIHFPNLELTIATYEAFRDKIDDFSKYDFLVFDESHRLKNPSAKMTKKAVEYAMAGELPPRILLSGTPADRYYELYSQLKVLNPADKTFTKYFSSYTKFINYYYYINDYYKPTTLKDKAFEKELKEWFLQYAHIVKKEDVVELPPLLEIPIRLKKTKTNDIDFNFDVKGLYTVSHFITEYRKASMSKDKLQWILEFLEDNPQTIVFSLFRDPVMELKKQLGNKIYAITGEYKKEFDDALKKQDRPIITTYALKEGANLQKYFNIVYLSLPLSYRDYQQSLARAYRTGQEKKVNVYKLFQQTIDYKVYNIIKSKASVYDYLRKEEF
jgi:superfamily II DNA or RNA helicase